MIALEVLGAVVLLVLVAASTWMAVTGLLGAGGIMRLRRCRACGHLRPSWPRQATFCPYCRHPWAVEHVMPVHLRHFLPGEMEPSRPPRVGRHLPGPSAH